MQSLDSSEMLKGVKRLKPFSTGQLDQAERSQATYNNQNILTNAISMHYGLLIINDYNISISEILSELKFYLDSTIVIQNGDYHYFCSVT